MTQEEKAKAYDEAIERAKVMHEEGMMTERLEYLFPELAEIKDERIRKWLIGYFNQYIIDGMPQVFGNGLNVKDVIAWLEKQGKQKPVEWKQENVEELSDFENAMMHIGGSFFGENAGLDPNDTASIKEQAELLLELAPKTEWSEEDKKKINRIYQLIAEAADEHAFSTTCRLIGDKECVELQDFLRSLKPLPKREWSEEDEKMCQETIDWFEKKCFPYAIEEDNPAKDSIKWLKSLKQRIGE